LILREGGTAMISGIVIGLAVLGWLCSRFIPPALSGAPDLRININFMSATWPLLRHAASQREVFLSIMGISWFWLVGFTFLAQFPIYAANVIGGNEEVVTLFLTAFSVGIALGSLLCNTLLKGRVTVAYVPLGAIGMTTSILLLWLASPSVPQAELVGFVAFIGNFSNLPVLLSLVATAIFAGIYIVPLYALMQTRAQVAHRSRTIAANNVMNALFMVMGALITMAMLKADMAVTDIFLTIGLANIPVALLIRRGIKA
jgi:acyl-[acyl-carrier-protein]-phospholipid O-acyltransferase/long-chain-fatty-acid--[acyl-carrier-protein] ligase